VKEFRARWAAVVLLLTLTIMLGRQTLNATVSPGQLSVNPSSISFGSVPVGQSQSQPATLSNSGGTNVMITQETVSGTGFSVSGLSLPLTLSPGQTTTVSVNFTPPPSGGDQSGTVSLACSVSTNPGNRYGQGQTNNSVAQTVTITVSGSGAIVGQLAATPSPVTVGNAMLGTIQTQSATVTNSGSANVTISQATVTGAGFGLGGLSTPLTLAPGQSKNFSVTFAPQSTGTASGNIAVASDAMNSALNVPLSATGVAPGSLTSNPSSLGFGSVPVGSSQSLSETLTNSGGSSVSISQATVTGTGFSVSGLSLPLTLAAGQSTTFSATFSPQSAGSASGTLSVTSNASNSTLAVSLSGTGVTPGVLGATSSSISFGSVQVGNSTTQSETLTNSGGSSVTVSQANVSGSGFSVTGLSLPLTLTPGQSFTFGVAFAPTSAGSASGSISVVSNASDPTLTISLTGTGAASGQLALSPTTLNFGSVVVGQSSSLTATLSASGASVTVASVSTNTSEFSVNGISLPFTLAAGQSASFTVTFTPLSSGTASDSASFVSNASNSPTAESLTGSGTAPLQHRVSLSWGDSSSSVVGYNIYRGGTTGGPYTKINTALNATMTYTDSSVQAGQTYYYVTTAVDGTGTESAYSNQVQTVIPTP
jgi:Abnormal spindle-like microcephaly-assoc'd, ASPM-SPD-2-Hydin